MLGVLVDAAVIWLSTLFYFTGALKLAAAGSPVADGYDRLFGAAVAQQIRGTLPWLELAIVGGLVVPASRPAAGLVAASIGCAFAAVAGVAMQRKLNVGCGCSGNLSHDRLDRTTVCRGIVIVAAGLLTGVSASHVTLSVPVMAGLAVLGLTPGVLVAVRQGRSGGAFTRRPKLPLGSLIVTHHGEHARIRQTKPHRRLSDV